MKNKRHQQSRKELKADALNLKNNKKEAKRKKRELKSRQKEVKKEVPVFFAVDDNYSYFLAVALKSIKDNASKDYIYSIYVLHDGLKKDTMTALKNVEEENFTIRFVNVKMRHLMFHNKLHTRDYYSKSTYYRLFIQSLFPELDKAIYLDSDIIVTGDISELYNYDLDGYLVGAANEDVMQNTNVFGEYVEKALGINRNLFFNAGVLVLNLKAFRKEKVEERFLKLLTRYKFSVTQDEDYLNVICKDKILFISNAWNVSPAVIKNNEEIKLIHYKMDLKPWHYDGVRYGEYFWEYAAQTEFYETLKFMKDNYGINEKSRDKETYKNLVALAKAEAEKDDSYCNVELKGNKPKKKSRKEKIRYEKHKERLEVLERIKLLEQNGIFDKDVENDPPTIPLDAAKVDYLCKKPISKLKTAVVNKIARAYIQKMINKKRLIIKEINGIENLKNLNEGAVILCNHFNAFDNFAIQLVFEKAGQHKKRKLYKVIREGNYTSYKGLYGMFFRNCNTLPLCSSFKTMKYFLSATDEILSRGDYILIYPEQAMWWNYKKVRPFKSGAFDVAVRQNAPVLPVFITFTDSEVLDVDGFNVKEYTIHVMPPVYPDKVKSAKENSEAMRIAAFKACKEKEKEVYGEL